MGPVGGPSGGAGIGPVGGPGIGPVDGPTGGPRIGPDGGGPAYRTGGHNPPGRGRGPGPAPGPGPGPGPNRGCPPMFGGPSGHGPDGIGRPTATTWRTGRR